MVITYGRIFSNVCLAKEKLFKDNNLELYILKLNIIKPINPEVVNISSNYKYVFFFEESSKLGGIGESFGNKLSEMGFKGKYFYNGIDNTFVEHASVESQIRRFSLDSNGMINKILSEIGR